MLWSFPANIHLVIRLPRLKFMLHPQFDNWDQQPHRFSFIVTFCYSFLPTGFSQYHINHQKFSNNIEHQKERKREFPALLKLGSLCKYSKPHPVILKLSIPREWVTLSLYLNLPPDSHTSDTWPLLLSPSQPEQKPLLTTSQDPGNFQFSGLFLRGLWVF